MPAADGRLLELARRIQPPLQNVPIDNEGAGNRSVALSLFQGSDIDKEGPNFRRALSFGWLETDQGTPRIVEERVNAQTSLTRSQMLLQSIPSVGGVHSANDIAPPALR